MNRPAKRNALNLRALELLLAATDNLDADQLILSGRGPVFCSGLDLEECRRVATWPVRLRHVECLERLYGQLLLSRARTVAFVQGFAVGGGVGLAACADWVIAAADARFRIPQGELAQLAGIVLPVTSARQAATPRTECWLAGEIDAGRAVTCGLVDEVVDAGSFASRLEQARLVLQEPPPECASWRSPKRVQRVLTEMQDHLAEMQ